MINIKIKCVDSLYSYLEMSGHANYAESGYDIVCSGVTSATFTSINLIDKLDHNCYDLEVKDAQGFLHLDIKYDNVSDENKKMITLIMKNLIDMYEEIKSNYPKNLKINLL